MSTMSAVGVGAGIGVAITVLAELLIVWLYVRHANRAATQHSFTWDLDATRPIPVIDPAETYV